MKTFRGLKLILMVGFAAGGMCAMAQSPAQSPARAPGTGDFLIKVRAVTLSTPEQVDARKRSVVPSAVYWDNLYNAGKVAVLGAAQDGTTTFSVVILEGVSDAEAHSIADGLPSVRAGVTTVEVLPMQVYLEARPDRGRR